MGGSKQFRGKDCPYCGRQNASSSNDHVVAKSFFLDDERVSTLMLPQVPSCTDCNRYKSELENYVVSKLLIGSNHPEASRYRREKVKPRLAKNAKLRKELNLDSSPKWLAVNGIWQRGHEVRIDAATIREWLQFVVRGLYLYHFKRMLTPEIWIDVHLISPEHEAAAWDILSDDFAADAPTFENTLGERTFTYRCVQSPKYDSTTVWIIAFHGGITLRGDPGSADHWWCMTRPASDST